MRHNLYILKKMSSVWTPIMGTEKGVMGSKIDYILCVLVRRRVDMVGYSLLFIPAELILGFLKSTAPGMINAIYHLSPSGFFDTIPASRHVLITP